MFRVEQSCQAPPFDSALCEQCHLISIGMLSTSSSGQDGSQGQLWWVKMALESKKPFYNNNIVINYHNIIM